MKILFCFFNQCFKPYITTSGMREVSVTRTNTKEGIFRLTEFKDDYNNTFYTFGLKSFGVQPGHGGEWSSRPAVINGIFNVEIEEVSVKYNPNGGYIAMAMKRKDIPVPDHFSFRAKSPTDETYGFVSSKIDPIINGWYDSEGKFIKQHNM